MDILLFVVGLFSLCRNKLALTITIIYVLCSTYMQFNIVDPLFVNVFFVHNVCDLGLILYVLMLAKLVITYGVSLYGPMQKSVTVFFIFLLLNGLYDVFLCETSIGDAIRFLRSWIPLTIVYVKFGISTDIAERSFRQLGLFTVIMSAIVLVQIVTPIQLIKFDQIDGRGIKPPITSIIFGAFYLLDYWKMSRLHRFAASLLCVVPMLLNLKMTYTISVLLIVLIAVLFSKKVGNGMKIFYLATVLSFSFVFLSLDNRFSDRLLNMYAETETISSGETSGNFSYRILHSMERLRYITASPDTAIRGIGYVSETNYTHETFTLGVYNDEKGRVDQLDNGDILWSNVFVRVGLLGLALYLWMYGRLMNIYIRNRYADRKNSMWFAYLLVSLLFTSLGNDTMWYGYFFLYPILVLDVRSKAFKYDT